MITLDTQPSYNYPTFDASYYDHKRFKGPKVGERFPAFYLPALSEQEKSAPVFHHMPLVIETGSLTCPEYLAKRSILAKRSQRTSH